MPTISEGTFAAIGELPWPWPPRESVAICVLELDDGRFEAFYDRSGSITATLIERTNERVVRSVATCHLRAEEPVAASLIITWNVEDLKIYANEQCVASLSGNEETPDSYEFPPNRKDPPLTDFSAENEAAANTRSSRLAGAGGRLIAPGKYRSNRIQIYDALREELKQIRDLLRLLRQGDFHHAVGLSAIVRKMIVVGDPLPLLQLCAATIDAPIVVYGGAIPQRRLLQDLPTVASLVVFPASATPRMLSRNPVDIDVWLDIAACSFRGEMYTNRKVLKSIGDTLGAHFDRDVHPVVKAMRGSRSDTAYGNIDHLVQLIAEVAELIDQVSHDLMLKAAADE